MKETNYAWRACEVDGGAYIDGTELIMCHESSAIFRYAFWDGNSSVSIDSDGDGVFDIYADGMPIKECEPGMYEIQIVCKGQARIKSVVL